MKEEAKDRLTNDQIAALAELPRDTVKSIMTNRSDITMDQFMRISVALGVSPEEAVTTLRDIVIKQQP